MLVEAVPNTSISLDEMERICKVTTCSEFAENCYRLAYSQVFQIHQELQSRASRIKYQLNARVPAEPIWKTKAESALSIINQKIAIASQRLSHIRENNISILLSKIGGLSELKNNRLIHMNILLHIIDHYCQFSKLSSEEQSSIDAARVLGGVSEESKFGDLSYNPVFQTICSNDIEVATLTSSSYEEYGYLFCMSDKMSDQLESNESLLGFLAKNSKCTEDKHNSSSCVHCRSVKAHSDTISLLNNI